MGGDGRFIFCNCTDSVSDLAFVPIVRRGGKRKFDRTWGHYHNLIALGGITTIRSHLEALPQFDRTWRHYHNLIAQFTFERTDTPNYNSIAHSTF
ncbi:hypothetical protein [Microcoleus sp. S36b_A4]|uniref:hypothetical protein n=1 Tax=Microcoleus sp. S36b_A4 TaxID=3055420 RepID=UPI002FD5976B